MSNPVINMRKVAVFLILAIGGCARAREPIVATVIPSDSDRRPWTHLNFDNDPDHFQFAIVGDRTGRYRPGVFENGIAKLNLLRPEFVMSVGDLIEGYTKDEAEIDQQWDEIESFTEKLDAPFFYVPGNHDLANPIQKEKWRDRFGPAYYHFVYRDVLFLCLNTYDPESRISKEQIDYVERALEANPSVRHTCVFLHEPLWDYKQETGWGEVERLLLDRPFTVFAGHYHTYTKYVRHDRRYFVLATTGGGLKKGLASPELGAFDHVTWVTMRPDGPRVANVELNAIHDENVRTEAAANLINRVLNGNALEITPVLMAGDTFDRAGAMLTFWNDADVPMAARGMIPSAGMLRTEPDRFDVTVAPKSTASVPVTLRAQTPSDVAKLTPLTVKWTASFTPAGGAGEKPIAVPREDVLAVERVAPCPPRTSPVVVDGKLDEWSAFPLGPAAPDPFDCSYQFAVAHDEEFVYIAVKTIDDKSVLNPLKEPWSQDGVEIRFDARPEPDRSQGRGRAEFKEILVVSMSPGSDSTREKMVLYSAERLPTGVKAVCAKTPTGHAAEVAIPASYLNERQGGAWKLFRMNVCVDDYDAVTGPLKALWWRPDWRSAETFVGSGTFERKE
jgi:hypothetical protein